MRKIVLTLLLVLGLVFLVSCETTESENVTKVKIYGNFDTFVPSENHVAQLIKELTGVEVDYDFLPQDPSLANSKLYLDIAGQAQYHLLKLAPEQFNQLRGVGALLDLTELIEKYAPNIKNSVSEEVWKTATFNGKIYGVPQQNPTNNLNMALFLRKDLFVENGISLPETLTEFKDSLIELKGKMGSNFVPFAPSSDKIDPIRGAFGIVRDWVPQPDGSLKYWAETAAFEGYANYLKELVDAGLMQEGYLTVPGYGSNARSGLQNGTVGVTLDAWWSGNAIVSGIAASKEIELSELLPNIGDYLHFIPTLKGDSKYPNSTVGVGEAKMDYSVTYFYGIPRYMEKYAISVLKWMDKKLEPAIHKALTIGVEGVNHTVVDGKYFPILTKDADGKVPFDVFAKADYFLTGTNAEAYSNYWQARARKDPRQQFVWETMNTEALKTEFGFYDKMGLSPGFDLYGKNMQGMNNAISEFFVARITGQGTAITHAELVARLKADMKLTEVTAEINQWYDTVK